jgi:hypothetical protein
MTQGLSMNSDLVYQGQVASREKEIIEAQIQVLVFAWVFTKQQQQVYGNANNKITYNL